MPRTTSSNIAILSKTLGLKFGPVRKGVTPRRILEFVLNDMVMARADKGLAGDGLTEKYAGMEQAYKEVAHFIAPFKEEAVKPVAKSTAKTVAAKAGAGVAKAGMKTAAKAAD